MKKYLTAFLVTALLVNAQEPSSTARSAGSQPTYDIRAEYDVRVAMRDGVRLSTDVYRPDGPGRFPALVIRTPYDNFSLYYIERARFFAQRGYVFVIQDTRGRYDSEGDFYPFRYEANDGLDTYNWIATQSWSNGKIGTLGGSYLGATQWLPVSLGSPHIKAMAPAIGGADYYHDWFYPNGTLALSFATAWGIHLMGSRTKQNPQYVVASWDKVVNHLPLADIPRFMGWKGPFFDDLLKHPTYDSYWKTWSNSNRYRQIRAPVLNIGGWYDSFLAGTFTNYVAAVKAVEDPQVRKGQRLLIGPWVHGDIARRMPTKAGDIDFGGDAAVDLYELHLRWFDHWLKGIENGVGEEAPVRVFVMGANRWREAWQWPLPETRYTRFYLTSSGSANTSAGNGLLTLSPPSQPGVDRFTYDPANPVPSVGGNGCCWPEVITMGSYDQRPVEKRTDVLVYSTDPLQEDLEVTGPVTVELYAASSAPDTDFTVKLVDVHPDGYARLLTDGIVRARYRESKEQPRAIQPGRVYKYQIDVGATSNLFKKGHKVRIEVSSSNFPRYDRNLNTGGPAAAERRIVKANQAIHHGSESPSCITLPVIPSAESKPEKAAVE